MGYCAVCQKRISMLDSSMTVSYLGESVEVCEACGEKISLALSEPEENEHPLHKRMRDEAVEFFENAQSSPTVSPVVKRFIQEKMGKNREGSDESQQRAAALEEFKKSGASMPATTGLGFEGFNIVGYLGVYSCDYSENYSAPSDIVAEVAGMPEKGIDGYPRTAERAKRGAYLRLLQEAAIAGANAVIGVSFETYVVANTVVCASATGTAVMIEPAEN